MKNSKILATAGAICALSVLPGAAAPMPLPAPAAPVDSTPR